jgi:GDP-L-fucose synthase
MEKDSKIFVAGHNGMVGSAIVRNLKNRQYTNIIKIDRVELDLRNQNDVNDFFIQERPEYVILAAAKVGGIMANSIAPAEFIYDNLMIQTNIINSSYKNRVKKLLFLGSSCIYPKLAPQPLKEEYLLSGKLECSNEAYAIAKIAGIEMCKHYNTQYGTNYISVMPTNLYGLNDNYDLTTSHVLPAILRKFHEAKLNNSPEVVIWGTGTPLREFMHVDDMVEACIFLMENYNYSDIGEFINIGTGIEISIRRLAEIISDIVDYNGKIIFDTTKPDGTPRKLLDVTKLTNLGFTSKINLYDGIKEIYFKKYYDTT